MLPIGRVLRRPRTIALGVLIGLLVTAFVSLGFWQLRRLDEKRAFNQTLTARTSLPTVPYEQLPVDADEVPYRRVRASGTYRTDDEVLIAGRSRNTLAGHELVTPLELADGTVLLVDRGWVPLDVDDPPVALAEPPAGTVEVTGVLFPSQERGLAGPSHAPGGRLIRFHRIDVPRIAQQIEGDVEPWFLLLEEQSPASEGAYPQRVALPPLGEGPHRSYALQWFAFALIGISTYTAVVIKEARRVESSTRRSTDSDV